MKTADGASFSVALLTAAIVVTGCRLNTGHDNAGGPATGGFGTGGFGTGGLAAGGLGGSVAEHHDASASGQAGMGGTVDAGASDGQRTADAGHSDSGMTTKDGAAVPSGSRRYKLERLVTLQDVIADLNAAGYLDLADAFKKSGFHPDGIKMGKACTPTAGNLYVSSIATGSVLEIPEDGKVRPYVNARSGAAYGNYLDSQGNLFISYVERFAAAGGIDVVLAGTPTPADGKVCYTVPDAQTAVNDLIVTRDGTTLYFSDDTGGRIFRCAVAIAGQNVSCDCKPWWSSPSTASFAGLYGGVDGLVLDREERTLYFDNFVQGNLFKISINSDGTAGAERVVTSAPHYGSTDGMSLSDDGKSIYTAAFKDSGSAVLETNIVTGETQILIEDSPELLLLPGAAITAGGTGPDETFYISSLDLKGLLFGYSPSGTSGGSIVKATRIGSSPARNAPHCP